jgi:preprotein translocase subunit SecE
MMLSLGSTMSSSSAVRTVYTGADKFKLTIAALLAVSSLVVFYVLTPYPQWVRVLALLGLVALAGLFFLMAEPGRQLLAYFQESVLEGRKVVWPTRKEATQMTSYVFIFVFVMALFLWLTDKSLEILIYDLILGWRR